MKKIISVLFLFFIINNCAVNRNIAKTDNSKLLNDANKILHIEKKVIENEKALNLLIEKIDALEDNLTKLRSKFSVQTEESFEKWNLNIEFLSDSLEKLYFLRQDLIKLENYCKSKLENNTENEIEKED